MDKDTRAVWLAIDCHGDMFSVMLQPVQHTDIASDSGLSPVRRLGIIWTNATILSIRP